MQTRVYEYARMYMCACVCVRAFISVYTCGMCVVCVLCVVYVCHTQHKRIKTHNPRTYTHIKCSHTTCTYMITPTHMSRMYIHTHAHIHKYLRSCGRESQGEGEGEGMRSRDHGRRRGRGHAVDRVGERIRESLESLRSRERG